MGYFINIFNDKYLTTKNVAEQIFDYIEIDEVKVSLRTFSKDEILDNMWCGDFIYKKSGEIIPSDGDTYTVDSSILGFNYDYKENVLTVYEILEPFDLEEDKENKDNESIQNSNSNT